MIYLKIALLIVLAPLASGFITWLKNNLRLRRGPGVFQPYYNLAKYWGKDEVVSEHASWVFRWAPAIVLAATLAALCQLAGGDLLALVFLLALGRFFLALAGLDPASAFGGMGSSREMFIAAFAEPVVLLSVFAIALPAGATALPAALAARAVNISGALAVAALFIASLAETSRLPVDNQETHLELTMVHEAMVLEYSGRSLALIELAAYVKQIIFFVLIVALVPGLLIVKLPALALIVALVELSLAKMRLFRVVDLEAFAALLAFISIVGLVLGL